MNVKLTESSDLVQGIAETQRAKPPVVHVTRYDLVSSFLIAIVLALVCAVVLLTLLWATIRVTPIVDGDRAFIEWFAEFDSEPRRRDELADFLRKAFAKWLGSLRRMLEREPASA